MQEFGYISAMMVGLLGGVHCIGMCGGLVASMTLGIDPALRQKFSQQLPFLLAYNFGRIISYSIAGAIFGGLSWLLGNLAFQQLGSIEVFQQGLQIFAGIFMMLLAAYLAGWWQFLVKIEKLGGGIWKKIQPFAASLLPVKNVRGALVVGLVWGWLPCGLVYSVLFSALATGSPVKGAFLMFCFGVGTLPTLLTAGGFAAFTARLVKKPWVRQVAGLTVLGFGIYSLMLGLGWSF
ncbi:sulfite exporter TauE/SafE family protein [Pelagibaculum spongiae]|uniref:Urease accessory protein UreH-like transmembrane domain-containing protein n=1 Tax=Pelagibaculum spongiae TaxID=2080658 RepID=A0A2V1GQB8_9GAMM|nr:sulfite exporter TauE/SafE family protein [Pelagibaculum spongiae]PVZ63546.1 hypothetical protein DC094_20915 [Pelagibaculum spongiae]